MGWTLEELRLVGKWNRMRVMDNGDVWVLFCVIQGPDQTQNEWRCCGRIAKGMTMDEVYDAINGN
jgi:hypothetical protein